MNSFLQVPILSLRRKQYQVVRPFSSTLGFRYRITKSWLMKQCFPRWMHLLCHSPQNPVLYYTHWLCYCQFGPWTRSSLTQKASSSSVTAALCFPPLSAVYPSLTFILPLTRVRAKLLTLHQLGDSVATLYKRQLEHIPPAIQKSSVWAKLIFRNATQWIFFF